MKRIALLFIAIAFRADAWSQALPENPLPTQAIDPPPLDNPAATGAPNLPMWDRLEHLPRGQNIKVEYSNGRWYRCTFSGATHTFLYCATGTGSDPSQERQIARAYITDFKLDHDVRNGRIAFASGVVSVGLLFGLHNTRDEGAAVAAGMLGALIGTIPGSVASCAVGHCIVLPHDLFDPRPPSYAVGVYVPLRGFRRGSR